MGRRTKSGFTLIELLVVIAIIAILAAILFPVFLSAKECGRASKCLNNMKQVNTALVSYVDDYNGRLPDSSGMFYCRVFAMAQMGLSRSQAVGPYMQDLLNRYIKNKSIWLCPSISVKDRLPGWPGTSYDDYRWAENCGGSPTLRDAPTNYMWLHTRISKGKYQENIRVSGTLTSEIKRATRAVTFMEMPYWCENMTPHKVNGFGINVVFYDGHVNMERNPTHAYFNLSWQGWEY